MSHYGFYIIDPLENISRGDIPTIAEIVTRWLDPIVKTAGFSHSWVCFPQFIVTPQPHELMVYICSFEHSVVQLAPGAAGLIPNPMSSPHKGITLLGPPAASEVYIKNANPLGIAALIFHEAMHNKLQQNNSMHTNFTNIIMSAATMNITPDIAPTADESLAMSNALNNPVNQWADGQQILWTAAGKRGTDPLFWDEKIKHRG